MIISLDFDNHTFPNIRVMRIPKPGNTASGIFCVNVKYLYSENAFELTKFKKCVIIKCICYGNWHFALFYFCCQRKKLPGSFGKEHNIVDMGGWAEFLKFSPVSWNTLNNTDVGGMTAKPAFVYCICVYLGIIFILNAAILLFGRKKSLDLKEDQ